MKPFPLCLAQPAHEPQISALLQRAYGQLMTAHYEPGVLAAALPLMGQANPTLLASGTYYTVLDASGSVVGCGGWSREHPGTGAVEPGVAHIRHFATHPDQIGKGIGRLLYCRCRSEARDRGMITFECYSSLNAVPFYRALGFKSVDTVELPMGPGVLFPALLMESPVKHQNPDRAERH